MLRLSERIRAVEQGRAADGKELFGEKALHSQSRPAAASVTDSDVGMPLAEFADPRDQPFGGEGGQHADHQHAAAVGARCLSGGGGGSPDAQRHRYFARRRMAGSEQAVLAPVIKSLFGQTPGSISQAELSLQEESFASLAGCRVLPLFDSWRRAREVTDD